MRKVNVTETVVTVKETQVQSLECDCCGREEHGQNIEYWSSIERHNIEFGYGSSHDGDSYQIEVCDECIMKWFSTFKHKPKKTGSIDGSHMEKNDETE